MNHWAGWKNSLSYCGYEYIWKDRNWAGRILFSFMWIAMPNALFIDLLDFAAQRTKR